jgi:hypothetical protein
MLYKKIQAVNLFKDSLKWWSPLNIVNNYDTTRMMIINSLDNNNWKIILTQTPDSFNKISKKLDISKTISVYNDVFSLYRSQIYSLKNIEDKKIDIKLIENISHQMYMSWNNMDNNERKTGVESINSWLDNYNSYYENRVKLFRMPKIKLKNKVTDSNVVYWVKNDLSNSTKKLNNTKSFITNQKEIIEDIISEHITKYRFFISWFKDILKTLDQEEIYNNIDNNNPDNQIFNNYNKTFKQLIGLLDTFLIWNFNDIPKPFNEFYITISNCKQKIIKWYNNWDIDTLFRQLLIIHLELKLIRFDIFKKIYETEIKLENIDIDTKENKEYYKNLYTELLKYQEILIRKNFLWKYKIGKWIDNRFQKRLDNIDNILLKINNIKKVID